MGCKNKNNCDCAKGSIESCLCSLVDRMDILEAALLNIDFQPTALQFTSSSNLLEATFADGSQKNVEIDFVAQGTYEELNILKENNELKVGKNYLLLDYQTEYYIEGTNTSEIIRDEQVIQETSGFAFFNPPLEDLFIGASVTVTELPVGYVGGILVGDVTTVTSYFTNGAFIKFANAMELLY